MEDFSLCKEVSPTLAKDVDRSVRITWPQLCAPQKLVLSVGMTLPLRPMPVLAAIDVVMSIEMRKDSLLHDILGRRLASCHQARQTTRAYDIAGRWR